MMRKKKSISGIPAGIGIGALGGVLITVLGAMATAVLIAEEIIGENQSVYGVAIALILGAFIGAVIAATIAGEKRMIVCLACGVAFYVVLLCMTALFLDGMYENVWTTGLIILGSSAAAGFVGMRKKTTSYKSKSRRIRIP